MKALIERLNYDPETGEITWKVKTRNGHMKPGDIAGAPVRPDGYYEIQVDGVKYLAHRVALLLATGEMPGEVDHINRDRSDNRLCNLRAVTRDQNMRNKSRYSNGNTPLNGVQTVGDKFCAVIGGSKNRQHLGTYMQIWDAICARMSANYKHGYKT